MLRARKVEVMDPYGGSDEKIDYGEFNVIEYVFMSLIWAKDSNPSSDGDMAYGIAADGSGVYIVGYYARAIKKYHINE